MANNRLKCGIVYQKIAMRTRDDERIANYEWLKQLFTNRVRLVSNQLIK